MQERGWGKSIPAAQIDTGFSQRAVIHVHADVATTNWRLQLACQSPLEFGAV